MVLTRSQAAKNKANQSPEPAAHKLTKQPRKQPRKPAAADAAPPPADPDSPQQQQQAPAAEPKRFSMGAKLSALKQQGPASHPIASLPNSPAPRSGSASPDFTIPAGQPQAAAAAGAAPAEPAEPAAAQRQQEQQQQPQEAPAEQQEAEQQQQEAEQQQQQQQAAASEHAAAPMEAQQPQQPVHQQPQPAEQAPPQQPEQQAPPPAQLPRGEKLLKPLPDKPVACDKLPDGPEPVAVEVEYIASADLAPLGDPAAAVAGLAEGLGAADWLEAVRALNVLRQLAVHHPEACAQQLDALVPLVLKSVRSLRSSLCKTAIMAVADLYQRYGDALLPHTDVGGQAKPLTSLLAQILLKCSSNDKKFVIEEAQRALQVMVDSLTPGQALPLLLPYADAHKNPKVRGKAGPTVAAAVARMAPAGVAAFGLPRLLQAAGKLVTDNTPDARDSAKRLIGLLKAAFADPEVEAALGLGGDDAAEAAPAAAEAAVAECGEDARPPPSKWEAFCQANLGGSAALAVIKASSE